MEENQEISFTEGPVFYLAVSVISMDAEEVFRS